MKFSVSQTTLSEETPMDRLEEGGTREEGGKQISVIWGGCGNFLTLLGKYQGTFDR